MQKITDPKTIQLTEQSNQLYEQLQTWYAFGEDISPEERKIVTALEIAYTRCQDLIQQRLAGNAPADDAWIKPQ